MLELTHNPYIDTLTTIFFVILYTLLILEAVTPIEKPKIAQNDNRDWNIMEDDD